MTLPSFLVGAFGPEIKADLDIGDATFGAIFTIGYLTSAGVMQISGTLADRHGARRSLRFGVTLGAIAALVLGQAAAGVAILVVGMVLNRMAEATVQPATNTLVAAAIAPNRQGLATGIKQAAIPLSTALAGLAVPVLGSTLGWDGTFVIIAVLAAGAWLAIPPAEPVPHGRRASRRALWGHTPLRNRRARCRQPRQPPSSPCRRS